MILGLPYREVWCLDTEFVSRHGANPEPVCLVARELGAGRLLRLWQDQLEPGRCPFDTGPDTLVPQKPGIGNRASSCRWPATNGSA